MRQVIIGLDGSKASQRALSWAAEFVAATGDELVVVHAVRRPYSEIRPDDAEELLAERRRTLQDDWLLPATELGLEPTVLVSEGDPRALLAETAERYGARLVVLGRAGTGGEPGFLHLGSVVEHAAHHVTRPLAVIPAEGDPPVRRILLGLDGSDASAAAAAWCAGAAPPLGAEVIAVNVAEPPAEWTPAWSDSNWRRRTEVEMQGWIAPLTDADVPVECVVVEQLLPVDGLLRTADDRGADLLVVGTRGAGGFTGLRFGGVAMKVLHRAGLPLVLVPPNEE